MVFWNKKIEPYIHLNWAGIFQMLESLFWAIGAVKFLDHLRLRGYYIGSGCL
jgi:hypothetical protein